MCTALHGLVRLVPPQFYTAFATFFAAVARECVLTAGPVCVVVGPFTLFRLDHIWFATGSVFVAFSVLRKVLVVGNVGIVFGFVVLAFVSVMVQVRALGLLGTWIVSFYLQYIALVILFVGSTTFRSASTSLLLATFRSESLSLLLATFGTFALLSLR